MPRSKTPRKVINSLKKQGHMPNTTQDEPTPPDFLQPEPDVPETALSTDIMGQLMQLTGESQGMRFNIPQLRYYSYGKEKEGWYIREWDGEEKIADLGKEIQVTFLVKREYLSMWKNDTKYYTNRYDDRNNDILTLYAKKMKSDEPKVSLETGTFKELRKKFSTKAPDGTINNDLRLHHVWYVMREDGKMAELDISGDSMRSLFIYHDNLKAKHVSIASLKTVCGLEFKEKGSVKYFCATFKEGEAHEDFAPIFANITEIKQGIKLMKESWDLSQEQKGEQNA